jgi:uncharacterized radical SAM superfamily protein
MNARISPEGLSLVILSGQMDKELETLLKLRKEQMRIAKEMMICQRHLAACKESMLQIVQRQASPVYTVADLL